MNGKNPYICLPLGKPPSAYGTSPEGEEGSEELQKVGNQR